MKIRTRLLFTLTVIISVGAAACSDPNQNKMATVVEPSTELSLVQPGISIPTLGSTRQQLSSYVSKSLGRPFCEPELFHRVSIDTATDFISQIKFPKKETKKEILKYVEENKSHIIPLLARIKKDMAGVIGAPMLSRVSGDTQSHLDLLQFVYEPGVKKIPRGLGCEEGLTFDLTALNVALESSQHLRQDFGKVLPSWFKELHTSDPDDPNNPPSPTACQFTVGLHGKCCHCSMGWTGGDGCNSTLDCPHGDCCGSSKLEDQCPSTVRGGWQDQMRLQDLAIGASL